MKKEFIYFIVSLILFSTGFFLGKTQNDSGRYVLRDTNSVGVFDTKTGVIYLPNNKKYYKWDIKNGTSEEYKNNNKR